MKTEIANWLLTLPAVTFAMPVTVTIDGEQFDGAEYRQTRTVNPGCPAYARGEREYDHHALYIAGIRPKRMKANTRKPGMVYPESKYCWRRDADERDWYVACHIETVPDNFKDAHPFGPNFLLCPWTVTDGAKIDYYRDAPLERLPFTVEA